ncbi:MAG: fatty acid desaturase [Leptospiraceae bacterium]|nr:fatty acid desaturase [Leptospiraceae bacterium]
MSLALLLAWFVLDRALYWLYPIAYILCSLAFTSLFVIANDCGHYSFLKSRRVMSFVGHACMTPLFYPFYAWKYSHDAHHKYTNQLRRSESDVYFDNAWLPETIGEYESERNTAPILATLYRYSRIVLPLASIAHLIGYHYHPAIFRTDHRRKVKFSYHVAPNIPCYRLREANAALQASPYGNMLRQFPLTLRYLYTQWKRCHLWNARNEQYIDFNSIRRNPLGRE